MRTHMALACFVVALIGAGSVSLAAQSPQPRPSGSSAPSNPTTPASPPVSSPSPESMADNDRYVAEVQKAIVGSENKPAREVFKNVQKMGDMPAGRLLRVMQMGYARSLGASCAHCHVPGQWEKDDKPAKEAARGMMQMVQTINQDLLKKVTGLQSPNPTVNCTTCHRGQIKPALDLPARP